MPMEHDPVLPDPDEFDRQLRNITSGKAQPAKFTELSATERAKQAERGQRATRPATPSRTSWRSARKARKLRKPVGDPDAGSTWTNGTRRAKRTRGRAGGTRRPGQRARLRDRSAMRTTAVLAAFVVLLYVLHVLGFGPPWPSFDGGSGGSTRPTASPTPSSSPRHTAPRAFTAADPFAGSPAERFATGAAGIVLPVAHPISGYSARQVTAAYVTTKQLVEAGNLDPRTLAGGFPAAFARLLAPALRAHFVRNLGRIGVDSRGRPWSTRTWVSSFAPGSTALVGHVIKVRGYMLAMTGTDKARRVLRVHVDYQFVYPVQRPAQPATRVRVVVQMVGNADFAQWNDPGGPLQVWWTPSSASSVAGGRCDVHDGFIHPNFPGALLGGSRPTGKPINPYRLNPPANHPACQATTGT